MIGRDSIIAAGSVICSQVKIGKKCWVAPNSSILQKLNIGDGSVVGLGAVVIEDTPAGKVVAGNPAKPIVSKNKTQRSK